MQIWDSLFGLWYSGDCKGPWASYLLLLFLKQLSILRSHLKRKCGSLSNAPRKELLAIIEGEYNRDWQCESKETVWKFKEIHTHTVTQRERELMLKEYKIKISPFCQFFKKYVVDLWSSHYESKNSNSFNHNSVKIHTIFFKDIKMFYNLRRMRVMLFFRACLAI